MRAARLTALPRPWVAVLLVVAALDLAVVAAGTARGAPDLAAGVAPLAAGLGPATLVEDGALVAADTVVTSDDHALVVDGAARTATAAAPGGRASAVVLAGDGLVLVAGRDRWTVPYAGSLTAPELRTLLAGWPGAQRGAALGEAVVTGALVTALSSAVLALGVRLGSRLAAGAVVPRPRDLLARWSVSLVLATTAAALLVLVLGPGGVGRAVALGGTLAAATAGTCLLSVLDRPRPGPAAPATTATP